MDNETKLRMFSLEDALKGADRIIDLFDDSVNERLSFPKEGGSFIDSALKIMGLKKEVFGTEEAKRQREKIVLLSEKNREDSRLSMDFNRLMVLLKTCNLCPLAKKNSKAVLGEGPVKEPDLMVVGFSPSAAEELEGRVFQGKSGEYLDAWLRAISLSRERNAYLCNILKCSFGNGEANSVEAGAASPVNADGFPFMRNSAPADRSSGCVNACIPYLKQQINLIKPRAILCLGTKALEALIGIKHAGIEEERGKFFFYDMQYPVLCTYRPEDVLNDLSLKRKVWEDLQRLARFLNLEIVRK